MSRPEQARGELRARFLREARAAARFLHPNIVTVFDVGEEGEVTFIAMEYVAGRTLADLLAEEGGPVEAERAAGLAAQVADALGYAHAKGVVHRDVKPANLLVAADGTVKVADFGIARVPDSTLTQEATVLGTPAYMAPEMAADLRALARGLAPADVPGGATLALVLAAGLQALVSWRAALPARRGLVLGVAGGLLAVSLLVWLLSDPVRPARRLLAEGRRSEAIGLLLALEADDPDQVEARVLLLEHADSCAVRRRVARRLGEIGDPEALPALEAATRRGLAEGLCMGGTLDQAIRRIRGEAPKRGDGRRGSDRAGSAPAGQDPAADVKRVFQKIGEALR